MANHYHVKSQEDYDNLMEFLELQGCRWFGGERPSDINLWPVAREKTVVEAYANKMLTCGEKGVFEMHGITEFIEWKSTSLHARTIDMMVASGKRMEQISESLQQLSKALNRLLKEKEYVLPLPDLKTTDGETQYVSFKHGSWFASRKNCYLKQQFTESEVKELVPAFYWNLAIKIKENGGKYYDEGR